MFIIGHCYYEKKFVLKERIYSCRYSFVSYNPGMLSISCYKAFHGFGQAKFPDGGLVLDSSQFSILPQLPSKILLNSKVVKIDPKIIILLC